MSLRARYWTLVAAWFIVPPVLGAAALLVSWLFWVPLLAFVLGSHRYIRRVFRCPQCGAPLDLVRQARLWPLRRGGFYFPDRCHRCGHRLAQPGAPP